MIDKTYQPADVEDRIYRAWEAAGAFRAGRPERAAAAPYCIVIPPPNVTGSLHMGHALNNTLQDILARFERMRGKDVLWQPGTDHAGIATQMVVERQLMERQQPGRRAMGREAFVKRVWEWKEESGGTIINQLKRLGASCDWSRERFTMDEGLSKAVTKVFVQLYNEKLIYKDKRLVNWDPKLLTAISDLEVIQVEQKGHLWHFRYPYADDPSKYICIATTRPETMLGDGAVAVHPGDERYKDAVGKLVRLPLAERLIPVIADEYPDPEKGSGAVKITAAHDFNDFEVWQRHRDQDYFKTQLNGGLINLFTPEAKMNESCPPQYRGLDRYEARKRIVADLEALGLVDKIETVTHAVPHGDRSNVVIEPYLTEQWYVNAQEMAKPAIAAVRSGKTKFVPENWANTYFNWMENIQPWCISRQLWWGHQIPAWYGPFIENGKISYEVGAGGKNKHFVAATEKEALGEASKLYGKPVEILSGWTDLTRPDVIASMKDNNRVVYLWRDEDVLDTWFSSALWPFSTLGWPDKTKELARFYPTNTLVTGFDIIFFWVARMMMMGLHFMKAIPFHDVYIHRLVRDAAGAKMSKSKGNVVDPLGVIDQYGADALRFTLARNVNPGHDIRLGPQDVENNRNFVTKLWNAARFAEMNECATFVGYVPDGAKEAPNIWIRHEVRNAVREITSAIENYRFNEAAGAAYRFVWNVYCDWYLELVKPVLSGPDGAGKSETRAVVAWARDEILKLLHPFIPFVTEELWKQTSPYREEPLVLTGWPYLASPKGNFFRRTIAKIGVVTSGVKSLYNRFRSGHPNPAAAEITFLIGLIEILRSARKEFDIPAASVALVRARRFNRMHQHWIFKYRKEIFRLSRSYVDLFVAPLVVSDNPDIPEEVVLVAREQALLEHVMLPYVEGELLLHGIDRAQQFVRYQTEMQKAEVDIKRVDAKLSNEKFVANAPAEIVEEEKEKREEAVARKAKLAEAVERLKSAG